MKKLLLLFSVLVMLPVSAQTTPPTIDESNCWKHIDSGADYTIAQKNDGTIWGWGQNGSSVLGNQPINVSKPAQIGTDNDWTAISAGHSHILAIKSNGTLWAWGNNSSGAVGNGEHSAGPIIEPLQIGTDTDWAFISAGKGLASAAIKTNGTLWTWGFVDTSESLEVEQAGGDITTLYITQPTQMGTDAWKYVSVGHYHTAAIKADGTLWTWGLNFQGQLGQGNYTNVYTPVQAGSDTDWSIVKASNVMTAALKEDQSLWTWGQNTGGSLGTNSANMQKINMPVMVGTEKSWKEIKLGMNYFCGAIKQDGSLCTWGSNIYGAVGNGNLDNVAQPTRIESDVEWSEYSAGGDFSVALKSDGTLLTWGYNWDHLLGFNLVGNQISTPAVVDVCERTVNLNHNTLSQLNLYPNPTSDILHLANAENLSIENITVTDLSGKTVLSQKGNTLQVDVQQLPQGMYFLTVSAKEGQSNFKFIKE